MITLRMEQGGPEWELARLGRPTASQVDRILTPKRLQLSSQRVTYRNQILAEWVAGSPIDWGGASSFMDRGTQMEPEAREFYAFQRDVDVEQVGFFMSDDHRFGGSPDGVVGSDGLLEIKTTALHTHVGVLLDPEAFAADHRGQCQALLWLSGRQWIDLLAYSPALPSVIQRIEPDQEYHAALDEHLGTFLDELDDAKRKLADHRERPEWSPLPGEEPTYLETLLSASLEAA